MKLCFSRFLAMLFVWSCVTLFVCVLLWTLLGAALVVALRAHGPSSAAVAEHGLLAISKLAFDAANRTLLGEAGVCPGECVCACVQASVFTQYFLATTKFFWIRISSFATMQYLWSVFFFDNTARVFLFFVSLSAVIHVIGVFWLSAIRPRSLSHTLFTLL